MYKIIVTQSCMKHFFWTLIGRNNKKIAESGMIKNKQTCFSVVKPLSRKLKAKIKFFDLEKDFE